MSEFEPDIQSDTDTNIEDEVDEPSMYKVLLHNDDYTTMEFVVDVLMRVFHKPLEEAINIMWSVHKKGIAVCGIYPFEVAETKVATVIRMARENGHPLKCTMEKA